MVFKNRKQLLFIAVFLYWIKTICSYYIEFNLGIKGPFQVLISVLNPMVIYLIIIGIVSLNKKDSKFQTRIYLVNTIFTILLVANIFYYREFSDFLTFDSIVKSGNVAGGMLGSTLKLLKPHDILYFIDLLIFPILIFKNRKVEKNTQESYKQGSIVLAIGLVVSMTTLFLAEIDRPQLLTRSFDSNYIVKYLGLPSFITKSGADTFSVNQKRALADENTLYKVQEYVQPRVSPENTDYFGKLEGKNVVYIHLESFQQFLINYKIMDEQGVEHEVTPNLNKLFSSKETLSFDNFYHQVGQGKTSDAELMIDNSLFGSSKSPTMVKYGKDNTFFAAPTLLNQLEGYTSSVFHGNTATFWNRNNAYKSFGYDNFYSLEHFTNQDVYGYGLKDEEFFKESFEMYDKIPGKKYSKFIPVSHHFPYDHDMIDTDFINVNTKDTTINGYFITANYMDREIGKFIDMFSEEDKKNTVFVMYGDHFGISNSRNETLGKFLHEQQILKKEIPKNSVFSWTSYDNALLQKVPLMFYAPDSTLGKDGINHKLGGQIDVLPTLLRLLGQDISSYLFIGQDLLADSQDFVVFRDGSIIHKDFIKYKGSLYDSKGNSIEEVNSELSTIISEINEQAKEQLATSDKIVEENLLSMYLNPKLDKVDISKYNYNKK